MTTAATPQVECEQLHSILSVSDVLAAADFYTKELGFWLAFTWGDPPTMAGVNLGHVQIFLEQGTPNPKGCSVYFVIGDADELYEFQRANGVDIVEPLGDRTYGHSRAEKEARHRLRLPRQLSLCRGLIGSLAGGGDLECRRQRLSRSLCEAQRKNCCQSGQP